MAFKYFNRDACKATVLLGLSTVSAGYVTVVNAAILSPDEILRVEFSNIPSVTPVEDTLFYTSPNFSAAPFISVNETLSSAISHSLYDEGMLLGTYTQTDFVNSQFNAAWTSSSIYTALNPTAANLSTITDGTSSARIDIRLTSGSLDIDLANYGQLIFFGQANSAAGTNLTKFLAVTNVSIVSAVPVPAAVWLFGSGLIGLVAVARRKAQS